MQRDDIKSFHIWLKTASDQELKKAFESADESRFTDPDVIRDLRKLKKHLREEMRARLEVKKLRR